MVENNENARYVVHIYQGGREIYSDHHSTIVSISEKDIIFRDFSGKLIRFIGDFCIQLNLLEPKKD